VWVEIGGSGPLAEGPRAVADNLAYMIYTSGSTGRPKGVAIKHRSAAALLAWAERVFGAEELSGVLASTSITFDLAVFELFLPLSTGGRVILADNALALPELAAAGEVRLINTVPSAISELVRLGALPESVRTVNLAGEPLKRSLVERIHALPHVEKVYNLYGPSEDTTYSTFVRVPRRTQREPTIGVPIAGTWSYVLDRDLRPLPMGVPGELCLAGEGLARGYLNRPELTAASFVPDPFGGRGERLYRTGDLVRWLPGGELEFLGRIDHQVKIRGFRIEPGEVETALLSHAAVREAAVLALGDGPERRLVAYVSAEAGPADLRAWLEGRLPAYMVPSAWVILPALPRTPNGKVDRKALARIEPERETGAASAVRLGPVEELLAGIWSEVLKTHAVGAQDDFFALGGHSLLATRVVSRVREVFGAELPLRAIFEAPTVVRLAERLRAESHAAAPPIATRRREGAPPASFAQERLWFLDQLGDERASYNIPVALALRGPLDTAALAAALDEMVRRHEALRTTFASEEGRVVQVIAPSLCLPLPVVDLEGSSGEVWRLAREEAGRLFDLSRGPLLRTTLLRLGSEEHLLLLTMHHIVSDGWSIGVLLRELSILYDGFPLPELPVQYADFAVWQREWLAGEVLETQLGYWKRRLAGAPAVLDLPADRPRPAVRSAEGGQLSAGLSCELSEDLDRLVRRRGATLFMVLLAAFQGLLYRLTGQEDLTVGSPVANRNRAETEGLIGFFVNTLVLRGDLSGDPSFGELLARTRESALGAYAHQDLPFEKLVAEIQPERDLAHSPLFQVMLIVQNLPGAAREGWQLSVPPKGQGTAKYDLTLSFGAAEGRRIVQAEYRRDLFDAPTIDRLLGHFTTLLAAAVAEPERRLAELPLFTKRELQQLLFEWNDTGGVTDPAVCLHERFEAQVDRTPEAEALVCGEERLTYAGLDRRANRLARRLRRLGVGPEVRVGVALPRTAELVVGLLAILKAGGAYVPLDPAYPREHLTMILEDARAGLVLTPESLPDLTPESSDERLGRTASPGNLAYLIYTSGSTGRPKGVAIEHRSAAALLAWAEQVFGLEELAGVLASTSITFDLSVFELFLPLATGGRVILADHALALPELAAAGEVRLINTVPSAISELVRLGAVPPSVRTVNLAGEPLKRALVERIYALPHVESVYNLYGPSEDTTYSTVVRVPQGTQREPTIGVPVAGTRSYVLDRDLCPLPVGVPGELCLAGEGLARGYLDRPELTAASFVPDPFGGRGERLYRTGDLARWLPSGELEFLGRIDQQVKIRGFRIEPGEVEAALLAHGAVREAAVLALGEGSERRLAAYVAAEAGVADLRAWLEGRLPAYMIPSAWVVLVALPRTPNGKVDRKALTRIEPEREAGHASAAPLGPVEELLAGIWCEVLGRDSVAVQDDFFHLGGHSLLATRVVSRVREVFDAELPLRSLFEAPTLAALAARIEAAKREGAGLQAPPIRPVPRDVELRASFAQERLWFLDRFGTDRASYNLPAVLRLRGRLGVPALAAGLREIVRRHESLRTCFVVTAGAEPWVFQRISPPPGLLLPIVDLGDLPGLEREAEAGRLAREEARRLFDLSRGPLFRVTLVRLTTEEHALLLSMHHVISDGWSLGVLLRELSALYKAFGKGLSSPLPELPVQYADFAVWQRSWLAGEVLATQLGYWRERLAGAPAVLELPADRPRAAVQSARGSQLGCSLPLELTEDLRTLVHQRGVTLFMALLAGFQALLGRLTGRSDVPVGTPIANRNRTETEGLIGFFVNTLVLRGNLEGDPSFAGLLGRAREATLGAYAHQDLPFEKLVEELQPERSLAHSPLFQVMLMLQNAPLESPELPGLAAVLAAPDTGTTKFDLRLALTERAEGLLGSVVYNRDLFDATTVKRLAGHYEALLAAALSRPEAPLSELPLLHPAESQQLLLEWNDTVAEYLLELPLHAWIEAQAERTPEAVALTFEGESLTYRELDERANRLANYLRRLGAGPEARIGIAVERSLELVVGLLGILKAGAAYVPLDPSYPRERLAFMLEDSQEDAALPVLLTQERLAASLPPHRGRALRLDADQAEIARESCEAPAVEVLPEHPAYVIYTSGSTGRPKGAVNTHRAIVNRLLWMQEAYGLEAGDAVLQKTPFSLDVSVWEFFWPLMMGARLVVARPGGHQDSAYLAELIRREEVTTLHFVPSMLQVFLEQPGVERCLSLRRVICSGEALPYELQQRFFARLGFAGLHNLYGPTEAAVDVTFWPCRPGGARAVVPIGRPIANLRIHLLDASLRPVPTGVAGELHIGGVGLARGYLNRPSLTAERFVPDPLGKPGGRLYRTGDLARHLPDGGIEFLGRIDHQVKVRGFRIELGEIEAALAAHPGVKEAVVLAREDRPGDKRLVAYLTAEGEETPDIAELRRLLSSSLPEYMVPAAFVVLPALPLSPNGKVDRRALPAPEAAAPAESEIVAPRTALERYLAELWRAPLTSDPVGIHDDFFALGGNSITGAMLINQLQEKLGEIVHVVVLFDAPTVERMAGYLIENHSEAVARLWGPESLGERAAAPRVEQVDAGKVAQIRELIRPLPRRDLAGVPEPRNGPAVFVLAPPRSGTTLLRVMLGGHPRLFAPPELELLSHGSMAERRVAYTGRDSFWLEGLLRAVMELRGCGPEEAARLVARWEEEDWTVRRVYGQLQEWLGERILVEKTPSYAFDLAVLRRAEEDFEGALYVHLLRHPGGMIRSFEEARLDRIFFRQPHPFTRRELAELLWVISQENIQRFFEEIPEHRCYRLRFEDLVREPEPLLRELCGFLGLDFHPAMLRPYEDQSRRMTDGLHAESRMLGDVKFHTHSGIDAGAAERWREGFGEDLLGDPTARLAAALGYEVPVRGSAAIPRRERRTGEPAPLSFAQERLWFLGQFDPDSSFYNITTALNLAGRLDVRALARSLSEIRRRHTVLRTVFTATPAGPVQVAGGLPALGMPVVDLGGLPPPVADAEGRRLAREEGHGPFDLAAGPVLRTLLVRLAPEEHALVVTVHHIAADGWSTGLLSSELAALYGAFCEGLPSPLPELPVQYADFALWQRERLSGAGLAEQIAWWREALAGAPSLIHLPTDRPRPAVQRFRGGQVSVLLPEDLSSELPALGRQHGATLFMTLLAAFQALLCRLSGQEEVLVGSPLAGRSWPETEKLIGLFVNTLVLRGDLRGDPCLREILARTRRTVLGAFSYQEVPFEKLVEELQPERSLTHSPLFQVMFALQNIPRRKIELPELRITAYRAGGGTAKFDLNLLLGEADGRLFGTLEYNSDLFDRTTAVRLTGEFETLLRGLATDPERRLSDLPLVSEADRHQILLEWNDTAAPFPRDLCLHQPFEARAAAAPDALAVIFENQRLTYGELDRRANRLAHLLRSLGVGPGRLVAVHLERSAEMLVAELGIHKAGGAYVPVEVSWPLDRLWYILTSEGIAHAVTHAGRLAVLHEMPQVTSLAHVVCLDEPGEAPPALPAALWGPAHLRGMPEGAPPPAAGPDDLAYIIFTSGSTGRPKGVMVRHRPAVNLVHWVNRRFRVGPSDTLLFVTALSFDLSVYDVFGILAAGGTVRIASGPELRDPEGLVRLLLHEPITFWDSAPAALQQLVRWLPPGPQPAALRLVFNSGDWIPVTLPDRVRETFPAAEFVSLGGATEATIWSNFFPVAQVPPSWVSIPYGRPIENARYHVLDAGLLPCPVGVPGDLYIAGECLSTGYSGSPEVTADKYVPDPFGGEPGARLYRTGDRARDWPDGNLEFLGRVDTQVKVRGFRVELGEIESVLASHPAVREAVVLAREDSPGDTRLVAYVMPDGEPPAPLELRRFAQARLPEYMVPGAFVLRESWPLSPTGKLDRKALPPPESVSARPAAPAPPHTELERTIAEIWKEVLGVGEIGTRDNFFDAGGHSLLMARVHARLEEALGRKVSMVDLFQYPTIGALAAHLVPATAAAPLPAAASKVEPRTGSVAVVGLAGRFPGAASVDELWRNLRDEVESIRFFTDEELCAAGYGPEIEDPRFVKARGTLDGPDLFDAPFFDCPPREAQILDPQQRVFLECAWTALENAGYGSAAGRPRVGVFAGVSENTYVLNLLFDPDLIRSVGRQQISISNNHDYLPTRVSYKLNLRGPSVNVQTACSTSLVAVHLACVSLLREECEIALAGGVSVKPYEVGGYVYHEGGINSPDGHTRAFDADAQGVVGGSGAGIVVLKRLEDALADGDTIRAVIRGSAINNDGAGKVGFTAPSVEGQAAVIREAHRAAGVSPETITYVEAHGTATPMGDPIEAAALIQAFGETPEKSFCALGSVKTNLGHLDAAAGIAGLIKTVLALENRTIPASLHFERPNPKIPFNGSPFYVNARTAPWPANGLPRRAGVSSFGIGGTNAHAVLEEAPLLPASEPSRRPARLLVLSARTESALDTATANLAEHLENHPDVCL
ncbi:MAG TPA: amino acid adenylation domain-containing protein, partial [Thermoanaerobaculia bacterium]|nr:amino acid adenylation domain-containing protein [Thermoanaerobaculia bacterium]